MYNLSKLNKLSKRIENLLGEPPMTFEQFAEKWKEMDGLSRSLYELSSVSPELSGKPRNYERISEYLRRLGVNSELIDTQSIISTLTSDD